MTGLAGAVPDGGAVCRPTPSPSYRRACPSSVAVAPGNARSLRGFLAAGFVPVGSEVIVEPGRV